MVFGLMQLGESDIVGAVPLEDSSRQQDRNPKSMDDTPQVGQDGQRDLLPYSMYRALRLDGIRTALGLGTLLQRPAPCCYFCHAPAATTKYHIIDVC